MEEWAYNTKDGIKESILTLEAFHEMLNARRVAYHEKKQRLNSFIVLGRWYLDECGNCGTAMKDFIPAEHLDIDLVVTKDELFELIRQYDVAKNPDVLTNDEIQADGFDFSANTRPFPTSVSYGIGWAEIPEVRSLCPYCK